MKNFSAVGGKLQSKGVYDVKTTLCSKGRLIIMPKEKKFRGIFAYENLGALARQAVSRRVFA